MNFINLWFFSDPRWQFTNVDTIQSITRLDPQYPSTPAGKVDIGVQFKNGKWIEARADIQALELLGVQWGNS